MNPMQMLAELSQSYNVKIWHDDDGAYRLELYTRHSLQQAHGPHSDDLAGRYVEAELDRAVARAWAGERPDA